MFDNCTSVRVFSGVDDMVGPYFPYTERRLLVADQIWAERIYRALVTSSTPSRWNLSSANFDITSEYCAEEILENVTKSYFVAHCVQNVFPGLNDMNGNLFSTYLRKLRNLSPHCSRIGRTENMGAHVVNDVFLAKIKDLLVIK